MKKKIYLDYAATTPLEEGVLEAMAPYFSERFGNPSSTHSSGQEGKSAVEKARGLIAGILKAQPSEIIFTSSGTESNNLALKGAAFSSGSGRNHIIVSAIEHPSVIESAAYLKRNGFQVTVLPVDEYGLVDPEDVKSSISDKTVLVSVMHANNEIGTIEPVAEIGKIARERNVLFHMDSVQSFGHIPFTAEETGADMISISSHKIYGPKGVGAMFIREDIKERMEPLLHGGGQEFGLRSSTHNVPGIAGFGRAAEIAKEKISQEAGRIKRLRDKLISGILGNIEDTILNGHPENRLPGNANISFIGIKSDVMILNLDMNGISVSGGSACKSANFQVSHVLKALGSGGDIQESAVRFCPGRRTAEPDIDYVIDILKKTAPQLRKMRK